MFNRTRRWMAAPILAGAAIALTAVSAFAATPTINRVGSHTWAGYAVLGAPGTYTSAAAQWVVPGIQGCPDTGDLYSITWVGLDGAGGVNHHVQQVGTEQSCYSGHAVYRVFTEMYPAPPQFAFSVSSGDHITAGVTSLGNGQYGFALYDADSGQSLLTTATAATTTEGFGQSAEAIFETPAPGLFPSVPGVGFHNVLFNATPLLGFDTLYAVALLGPNGPVYVPSVPPTAPSDFTVSRVGG